MSTAAQARLGARSTYFYLSYTHVPPTPDRITADTSHWVKLFYSDLHSAVRERATTSARIGFYDALLSPGSNWNELVSDELGAAEVFVPLYAPGYFSRSWSKSEWDSFQERLRTAGAANPDRHICPVLWIPLPADDRIPLLGRARDLGADIPGYLEDGLQAMARLRFYHDSYRRIVNRLADEIVRIAEEDPLGPSATPPLSEVIDKIHLGTPFVVAVLAPTTDSLPAGRRSQPYGATSTRWRPYGDADTLPVAETASWVAERLNLDTQVIDFDGSAAPFEHNPGLILVDPWVFADPAANAELIAAIQALPPWVDMIAIVDVADPQYDPVGANLAERLNAVVSEAGRQVSFAHDADGFVQIVEGVIVRAQNAYFRKGPSFPPPGPHDPLPRLTYHDDDDP